MGFFERLFTREATPPPSSAPVPSSDDDAFGAGLDEHDHLIVARFSPARRSEYLGYGADALVACRALEEGLVADAIVRFDRLIADAASPVHLFRDVGRARFLAGDRDGAYAAFERFLDRGGDAIAREDRLATHVDLATIADERGEVDRAIEWLAALVDRDDAELAESLTLGQYLRMRGFPAEALDVLRGATDDAEVPPSALLEETGLCLFALGDLRAAERHLDEVVRRARCSCGKKVPESTAAALAAIYESTGRIGLAEEILRSTGVSCRS